MAHPNALQFHLKLRNVVSLRRNIPLYKILSGLEGGFITSFFKNYRVGLIVVELLKYVKSKQLFSFPSTINCDEDLHAALRVKSFEVCQLADLVLMATCIESTPVFEPHEEFILQNMEQAIILKLTLELSQTLIF
jgi:hypothetical protein